MRWISRGYRKQSSSTRICSGRATVLLFPLPSLSLQTLGVLAIGDHRSTSASDLKAHQATCLTTDVGVMGRDPADTSRDATRSKKIQKSFSESGEVGKTSNFDTPHQDAASEKFIDFQCRRDDEDPDSTRYSRTVAWVEAGVSHGGWDQTDTSTRESEV